MFAAEPVKRQEHRGEHCHQRRPAPVEEAQNPQPSAERAKEGFPLDTVDRARERRAKGLTKAFADSASRTTSVSVIRLRFIPPSRVNVRVSVAVYPIKVLRTSSSLPVLVADFGHAALITKARRQQETHGNADGFRPCTFGTTPGEP